MTTLREIKERGYIPPKMMRKLLLAGTIALGKVMITTLGDIKKLTQNRDFKRQYIRPPRRYE